MCLIARQSVALLALEVVQVKHKNTIVLCSLVSFLGHLSSDTLLQYPIPFKTPIQSRSHLADHGQLHSVLDFVQTSHTQVSSPVPRLFILYYLVFLIKLK